MAGFVCYVSLFLVSGLIHCSSGQGNVFSANRRPAARRQIVPRPPTSTMSPEHMQIAMRNKAMAMSASSSNTQGSKANNAPSNSGSNKMASATGGGQNSNSNQPSGNRWQMGNNNRQRPMMFCPHQMPSDCPEIQPKPGCYSQNIMSWMGRPCRGCPFDMCERSGHNPMDMAKKMVKMGMNPLQFMNQMNPMSGMHPAMMYNSNFYENMPSWMPFMWANNANTGSSGSGGGGSGTGNSGGGGNANGGNNQGGGGGSQSQNTNNNNHGAATTTMSPWLWHSLLTK